MDLYAFQFSEIADRPESFEKLAGFINRFCPERMANPDNLKRAYALPKNDPKCPVFEIECWVVTADPKHHDNEQTWLAFSKWTHPRHAPKLIEIDFLGAENPAKPLDLAVERLLDPGVALERCFGVRDGSKNTAFCYVALKSSEKNPEKALLAFVLHGVPKGETIHIHNLGVRPDARRRGLGAWIKSQSAFRLHRDHGVHTIDTRNHRTNTAVIALNKKLGYRVVAEHIMYRREPKTP